MGRVVGISRPSSGTAAIATATPRPPPSVATSRLSVRSWRTNRSRPAPSAVRTTSSRWRTSPRASSRLARLAQAMSSTHSEAPHNPRSKRRDWSEKPSLRGYPVAPDLVVFLGILTREVGGDDLHFGASPIYRDTGPEPGHHLEPVVGAAGVGQLVGRHREPELDLAAWKVEIRRHHTENDVRLAVEDDGASDDLAAPGECLLPQRMAQQDPLAALGRGERSPDQRPHAEHRKQLVGHDRSRPDAAHPLRAGLRRCHATPPSIRTIGCWISRSR